MRRARPLNRSFETKMPASTSTHTQTDTSVSVSVLLFDVFGFEKKSDAVQINARHKKKITKNFRNVWSVGRSIDLVCVSLLFAYAMSFEMRIR